MVPAMELKVTVMELKVIDLECGDASRRYHCLFTCHEA
ncbi:MAG: hypothetical protein QOJ98_1858 [Acidobacteriota bacterium]|nr:hypothetical protein [Acidobacteriota bacterium]